MTAQMSAAEARRTFLDAQGLARKRPPRRPRERDFAAYLERQGIVQLDSVNVLARAHYMPFFSRLGSFDRAALDQFLWGDVAGHSAHTFEHWGHEASVMPLDVLPLMHHRMRSMDSWKARMGDNLEAERPGLIEAVLAAVEEHGPGVAADFDDLAPRAERRGSWWDHNHVKIALEYLFFTGQVAASRGRHFSRTYDAPMRAWGHEGALTEEWGVGTADARQTLFDRALSACGISTAKDLCDHYRLPYQAGPKTPDVEGGQAWAASAVERGIAEWVTVEGWGEPALLAVGAPTPDAPWRRPAQTPARATGEALLSPFDPVCWFRPRLLRMFGVDYRIEIYTPAAKRQYGYYSLPLLVGDRIGARLDLKADRKTGTLVVKEAWVEPGRAPGARRLDIEQSVAAAACQLAEVARWLELGEIAVEDRGDLADPLRGTL